MMDMYGHAVHSKLSNSKLVGDAYLVWNVWVHGYYKFSSVYTTTPPV